MPNSQYSYRPQDMNSLPLRDTERRSSIRDWVLDVRGAVSEIDLTSAGDDVSAGEAALYDFGLVRPDRIGRFNLRMQALSGSPLRGIGSLAHLDFDVQETSAGVFKAFDTRIDLDVVTVDAHAHAISTAGAATASQAASSAAIYPAVTVVVSNSVLTNVATIVLTAATPANMIVDGKITVAGTANLAGAFNGTFVVTAIAGSTVSYALVHADEADAADTGTVQPWFSSTQAGDVTAVGAEATHTHAITTGAITLGGSTAASAAGALSGSAARASNVAVLLADDAVDFSNADADTLVMIFVATAQQVIDAAAWAIPATLVASHLYLMNAQAATALRFRAERMS